MKFKFCWPKGIKIFEASPHHNPIKPLLPEAKRPVPDPIFLHGEANAVRLKSHLKWFMFNSNQVLLQGIFVIFVIHDIKHR